MPLRHSILKHYDPKRGISIATLSYEYRLGSQVPEHAHGSDQLVYAICGVMEVYSGQSMWLIPPHFALWIPARTQHRIHMRGAVSMRTLYIRPRLVSALPTRCEVLHVSPLLRELIVEAVRIGQLRTANYLERALRDLVIAQLEKASPVPIFVTLPSEPRALAVSQAVLKDPAQSQTLGTLCAEIGVSVRTIERAFRKHVGTDFESWRRQVRLMKAVELLLTGCSVKQAAFGVGYHQGSSFIEAFRRAFGTTPKSWVSRLEKLDAEQ